MTPPSFTNTDTMTFDNAKRFMAYTRQCGLSDELVLRLLNVKRLSEWRYAMTVAIDRIDHAIDESLDESTRILREFRNLKALAAYEAAYENRDWFSSPFDTWEDD